MSTKLFKNFYLITVIMTLLISACGAKNPPAPQTLSVGNYEIETLVLNDAEIVSSNNVVCVQHDVEVNCKNIDKSVVTILKKDKPEAQASIQIRVLSADSKLAEIKFVRAGNRKCPNWVSGFTTCDYLESTINYLR